MASESRSHKTNNPKTDNGEIHYDQQNVNFLINFLFCLVYLWIYRRCRLAKDGI